MTTERAITLRDWEVRAVLNGATQITGSGVCLVPIPSAPNDDYMAGTDGRVYSRTRYKGFGKKLYRDWYPLVGYRNTKGYHVISFCHKNQKVTRTVHRLVCEAFHGTPACASLQVRHLDGNSENNLPENLAWGTQEENWSDRQAHGRGINGEKHPMAKLSDEEATHVKWAVEKGLCSEGHAARVLGLSQSGVSHIVRSRKSDSDARTG